MGDTRVKAIKSDSDSDSDEQKKSSPGFSGKNRGVVPSVSAPGVTHPSDATALQMAITLLYEMYKNCIVLVHVFFTLWNLTLDCLL